MAHASAKRWLYRIALLACCVVLAACENPWLDEAPSLEKVLSQGWLFGDPQAQQAPKSAAPVYCYETIGDADCYDEPLVDGGNRLVGFEGPAPLAIQR